MNKIKKIKIFWALEVWTLIWVLLHTGACAQATFLTYLFTYLDSFATLRLVRAIYINSYCHCHYCHTNNAITHSHAATNIINSELVDLNNSPQ